LLELWLAAHTNKNLEWWGEFIGYAEENAPHENEIPLTCIPPELCEHW
jgi:hypothetical protein